ncbi:MAG: hypothetical protein K2X84_09690, partial [Beijerinckiaceae bacterium]|nr:hypothetical protein [Beijerinckiaceae bacterium]
MTRSSFLAGIIGALALAGIGTLTPASATEALPAETALRLDLQEADYSMTAAKRRRLYMMQEATRPQRHGGGGYGRGPVYGRGYG